MYQRRRRRPVSEMNVVPYIDVMLVLLIIFMATASVIAQGVNVDLPKANAQTLETEEEIIMIVSIDAQGQYYLNVGDNPDQPIGANAVAALVRSRLQADPTIPVVVNGDRNISYEKVIDLMVLLQNSGASSVGLMTDPNAT
ncbi:protein TolR [Glaciecola sp. XM2]|jgi:biopolymer transport protein TolR|uniref:protein TolR n=1 Tax=Glaciecola sp. XM2 TaxID=1914931 RepID=UPI001BDF274E|nr:protein TolR [Glaciecola sp. XM2]MBT1450029.1 protein TolR [Glaciecola sp. XM2]